MTPTESNSTMPKSSSLRLPPVKKPVKDLGVRTPKEVLARVETLSNRTPIIPDLIPSRCLGIIVGDSGLGKSPLLYQIAFCIAEGIPFIERPVSKGTVVYLDYENGLAKIRDIWMSLCRHLNLDRVPSNLLTFTRNDVPNDWIQSDEWLEAVVRKHTPLLVIIDSLSTYCPGAEMKNDAANVLIQKCRTITNLGTSLLFVHHRRKGGDSFKNGSSKRLEPFDSRDFLEETRGASSLISSMDFRLAIDSPTEENNG